MRLELGSLVRTTTFRLALAQAALFTTFAFALLSYLYYTTAGQMTQAAEAAADREFSALEQTYAGGGLQRLNAEVIERVARGGAMVYVLADQNGRVISGSFDALPFMPAAEAERVRFSYERLDEEGEILPGRARGRIGRLLGGPILLVAQDMGDNRAVLARITGAIWTGALLGLAFSLLAGFVAGRQAARRAEALSRTARDVMAGDLARRAPVAGAGDEFDDLAQAMNAMLARIERLVQYARTAGDAIAHDLRTPLTRMRQRLEAALEQAPAIEPDREALRKALEECDELLGTFNAILRLSRLKEAEHWRLAPTDVAAIAAQLGEFYEPAAEEAGIAWRSDIAGGLTVVGDAGLLTQALSNLLENAIKFTPTGGQIRLVARRLGAQVALEVIDSGPGIAPEDRERVLERFYRVQEARTTPGSGLGLSMVSAIATLHRGRFSLEDGLGGPAGPGLSARLFFPAAPMALPSAPEAQ